MKKKEESKEFLSGDFLGKSSVFDGARTWSERRMIVDAHYQNGVPITQLSKNFGVSRNAIYKWIRTFASGKAVEQDRIPIPSIEEKSLAMARKKEKSVENIALEVVRLKEENKRLSEALRMSEWMNHAKDVMIDEAEKTFNIPIRKKSGAKQ